MADTTDPDEFSLSEPELAVAAAGPRLQRIVLGSRLRQLRENRQVGRKAAAAAIRGSESKISRLELGRIGYKIRDVADLLDLYGVTGVTERDILLTLADQASAPAWWHPYRDIVTDWAEPYLSLEQDARVVRVYDPCRVPVQLQTADYARAVLRSQYPEASAAEIGQRVDLRLQRQDLLWHRQPDPPHVWAILDESVLHRPAGTQATMRQQLTALADAATQRHIQISVVPYSAGQAGAIGVPFSILRFPGDLIPDLVYVRCPSQAIYPERPDEIRHYWHLMNTLAAEARAPGDVPPLLDQALRGL